MKTYEIIEDISAPITAVWAVLEDVENWPQWTSSVESIVRLDQTPFGAGSKATIRQPELPEARWTVTVWEPPFRFVWQTERPGIFVTAEHLLSEKPNGTNIKLSVEFGGAFGAMAALAGREIIERFLALEARGLKERCERT